MVEGLPNIQAGITADVESVLNGVSDGKLSSNLNLDDEVALKVVMPNFTHAIQNELIKGKQTLEFVGGFLIKFFVSSVSVIVLFKVIFKPFIHVKNRRRVKLLEKRRHDYKRRRHCNVF